METPKEYYYTYYSYEEYGRGYFGSRGCGCLPEEDVRYLGSFTDKTFKPTQKIILKDDYATREEAYADEIILHDYYDVGNNPHFANRAKATSTKFRLPEGYISPILYLTKEQLSENGKKGTETQRKLGLGLFSLTTEQRQETAKKVGKKAYELGLGIHSLTFEQKSKNSKKSVKIMNAQRWECCETGYVSTPAGVVSYQKGKGIDTSKSNRRRIS